MTNYLKIPEIFLNEPKPKMTLKTRAAFMGVSATVLAGVMTGCGETVTTSPDDSTTSPFEYSETVATTPDDVAYQIEQDSLTLLRNCKANRDKECSEQDKDDYTANLELREAQQDQLGN